MEPAPRRALRPAVRGRAAELHHRDGEQRQPPPGPAAPALGSPLPFLLQNRREIKNGSILRLTTSPVRAAVPPGSAPALADALPSAAASLGASRLAVAALGATGPAGVVQGDLSQPSPSFGSAWGSEERKHLAVPWRRGAAQRARCQLQPPSPALPALCSLLSAGSVSRHRPFPPEASFKNSWFMSFQPSPSLPPFLVSPFGLILSFLVGPRSRAVVQQDPEQQPGCEGRVTEEACKPLPGHYLCSGVYQQEWLERDLLYCGRRQGVSVRRGLSMQLFSFSPANAA